jgi:hypothetical protein
MRSPEKAKWRTEKGVFAAENGRQPPAATPQPTLRSAREFLSIAAGLGPLRGCRFMPMRPSTELRANGISLGPLVLSEG